MCALGYTIDLARPPIDAMQRVLLVLLGTSHEVGLKSVSEESRRTDGITGLLRLQIVS
jgi:hypothetical protein